MIQALVAPTCGKMTYRTLALLASPKAPTGCKASYMAQMWAKSYITPSVLGMPKARANTKLRHNLCPPRVRKAGNKSLMGE